jgi:hypothetical protein
MAVGHWKNLTEAQKLTQSQLIPGVIEEDIYRENLLDRMPVALAQGKSIKWNRESTVLDTAVTDVDIGEQLTWTSSVEYSQQDTELKRSVIQRLLDNFIVDVYGTFNNYETQALWEIKKGMFRNLGDKLLYDDITYGSSTQFDGLHALAAVQTGTDLDIDEAGALSLLNLRTQIDAMKHGVDIIYMPIPIARRLDAFYYEAGGVDTANTRMRSLISFGINDAGKRVTYFDSIPIVKTDYLVLETDGTGVGSNARAKSSSGTTYSIFCIKFGDIFNGEPGLCMGFGDPEMGQDLYKVEYFDKLENYDAKGIRLVTYVSPLLGSKLCLGRIYDITDAAVTS